MDALNRLLSRRNKKKSKHSTSDVRANNKYRMKGPGRSLRDSQSAACASHSPTVPPERAHPTESAQMAAVAALSRFDAQKKKTTQSDRYLAAIRAQAIKEIELEREMNETQTTASVSGATSSRRPETQVSPSSDDSRQPVDSVDVYFTCDTLGLDEPMPRAELVECVREKLYELLSEEGGISSCLIIRTCNPVNKVSEGVRLLLVYLDNICQNPSEPKYRKIRVGNRNFADKIALLDGHRAFLSCSGFQLLREDGSEVSSEDYTSDGDLFWVLGGLADIQHIQKMREALSASEALEFSLDRDIRVYQMSQGRHVNLPDDFYRVSVQEVRREAEKMRDTIEDLTTLQLRDSADKRGVSRAQLNIHNCPYTIIRVTFPHGLTLQATFHSSETLQALHLFVQESLREKHLQFSLVSPQRTRLEADNSTLLDANLAPSSVLKFNCTEASNSDVCYLTEELMCRYEEL